MKSILSLFVAFVSLSAFGNDLEITNIQLNRYLGSGGSMPPKESTQSISIVNQSDKTIDLYDYSITNNGREILRIKEHVKLEKDAKKVFQLQPVNMGKENKKSSLIIAPCFFESLILFNDEKEYQKERENVEAMMKRYLPYVTEKDRMFFNIKINDRHSFVFSEIALISPQNETVDQILVTEVDVQKNPYSLVAFVNSRILLYYTAIFRKGDYIIVSTVPEMAPFQLGLVGYSKRHKALTALTTGNKYFSETSGFYVPDLKMALRLYRDKDFKEEIVYMEGQQFVFEKMSDAQADSVEKFFDGLKTKEVYYKLFVTHPNFPELSLSEPITGNVLFRQAGSSKKTTFTKDDVESATD